MIYSIHGSLECQRGVIIGRTSHGVMRIGCGNWECRKCGPRRVTEFCARALRMRHHYRTQKFITFTALPKHCSACDRLKGACTRCVRDFNQRCHGVMQAMRKRELRSARKRGQPRPPTVQTCWTNEQGEKTLHLHKHVISGNDFIKQKVLSRMCTRAGLGFRVDIRKVRTARGGVYYLTKYAAKMRVQQWGYRARRAQSSAGLKAQPTAEQVARREEWEVVLMQGHWWSFTQDKPWDQKMTPRSLPADDPRVLWLGAADRKSKALFPSQPEGGKGPVSETPRGALASVPNGFVARLQGATVATISSRRLHLVADRQGSSTYRMSRAQIAAGRLDRERSLPAFDAARSHRAQVAWLLTGAEQLAALDLRSLDLEKKCADGPAVAQENVK